MYWFQRSVVSLGLASSKHTMNAEASTAFKRFRFVSHCVFTLSRTFYLSVYISSLNHRLTIAHLFLSSAVKLENEHSVSQDSDRIAWNIVSREL